MSDFFGRVTGDQDIFKKLASYIPGFGGYVERQNRRAADKMLRETVANHFEQILKRASSLQNDLVSQGKIETLDDMERAVIKLRTFTDKISTASYGHSGLFDAVKINEKELEQIYNFDLAFFSLEDQINSALGNIEASLGDDAALPAAIRNLISLATQCLDTFERRYEIFTGTPSN